MDYYRKRDRKRILKDLINLKHQYDLKVDDDDDDDSDENGYRNYDQRRKEYCLVKVIYRNKNISRRRKFDEIMIIQNNQMVFKGCLQNEDQFTFKSQWYRNESRVKIKFYINDLLEDEIISCCIYGLINRNREKHLFHIEQVIGSKPCYDCEFNENISKTNSQENSLTKVKIPQQTSILSEDQPSEEKPKEKKSTLSIPQTDTNIASSEGFSGDITEFSEYHVPRRNQYESNEDSTELLSNIQETPVKRIYGPPQLSTMISITESLDTPSPNIRESRPSIFLFNSNQISNQTESNVTTSSPQYLSPRSSNPEQENSVNLNNSNNIAIVNDATQLLLTRLGIIRQEQVEHPEISSAIPPREKGNVEYFILVYLHEINPDEIIITNLRSLVNFLKIFNDSDDCLAYINTVSNEKIIFILSYSFHKTILSRIEELQQIYKIYILFENNQQNEISFNQSKIQGFYFDINEIYKQISDDIKKISRDLIIYLNASSNSTTIESIITYFLLLNEIILEKSETKSNLKELINFSRNEYEGNNEELKIIDEFEKTYKKNQAIYWFSRSCFISKMLNKALRIPEPDILFRLRIFIQDLYEQIENESTSESMTVYLGQTIQKPDLDDLQKNILTTDLIIFPQFLFGTSNQERAIEIAKQIPLLNDDCIPLIIQIDISEEFKCININSLRYTNDDEYHILLNMNIMGRLIKIEKNNQLATIHIRLIKSENQRNIQDILQTIRTEVKSFTPFVSMIKLMIQMNQQSSAEQIVQTIFNDENLKDDTHYQGSIAAAAHILAQARRTQEDYKHALDLYLLSLQAFHRIMSPTAIELSTLNSNIGAMYFRLEIFDKSYEYYSKALEIQLHSNTPDLYSISSFTNSIGIIYSKQEKYSDAIKSFERTIKILEQCTESHDTELSATYDDIGDAYFLQKKYNDALENYSKALEIQERIVPRNLQTLGTSYHTIGNIYLKLGQSKQALIHLKRALECLQEVLPLTHASFALLYNNIGLMYYREEDYSEALRCYSKSLEIAAISLPENHSLVGITLFNTALVYSNQEKYDEAIECIEKSTEQFLKTLPVDHPDVLENKKYMETIRQKKVLKNIFDENTISF